MKTRFCPSPTGSLHIGNMRTALFNYLYARKNKGKFLLRIEDTDLSRSKESYIESIQKDLLSLGLNWDEGVPIGSKKNSYMQSQRIDIYQKYYSQLIDNKKAYYCFCTEEELKVSKRLQLSQGLPPKYNGKCRELSKDEIEEQLLANNVAAIRFLVPRKIGIVFEDIVRGKQSFDSNILGDFIIRKADGMASFMFANAIDDALMDVTHILRGEDHLTNTPRQKLILDTLGFSEPSYAHISIIIGKDRQPLSKRNGSQSIQNLLEIGYLPLAILNYLARIGHTYENNELLSLDDLAIKFSLDRLVKSPAVFDMKQLNTWQKLAVLACSIEDFKKIFLNDISFDIGNEQLEKLITTLKNNVLLPDEVSDWLSVFFDEELEYNEENAEIIKKTGKDFFNIWLELLEKENIKAKELYNNINLKLGLKGKQVYMPIRIALTNRKYGPELQNVMDILGIRLLKRRIVKIVNGL